MHSECDQDSHLKVTLLVVICQYFKELYMHVSISMCMCAMCVHVHGGQERVSDPLGLKFTGSYKLPYLGAGN